MKKNKKSILLLSAIITCLFASCTSRTYEDISGPVQVVEPDFKPTYTVNIAPVINSNCVKCHPDFADYKGVKEGAQNGDIICRISGTTCGNIMPQSGAMPKATVDLIKLWQTQGYAE